MISLNVEAVLYVQNYRCCCKSIVIKLHVHRTSIGSAVMYR